MTETNGVEKTRVEIYSTYWVGRIEVEINKEILGDRDQVIISALPQIKEQAKLMTVLEITANGLKNDINFKYEPADSLPKESAPVELPVESKTVNLTEEAVRRGQQTMDYDDLHEPPYQRLGGLDPKEANELREHRRHLGPGRRA